MNRSCFHLASIVLAMSFPAFSDETSCIPGPRPELIRLRHIESKGLGYNKGYSSLDAFLTYPKWSGDFLPFVDLRGHVFNDGKTAANAGWGFRYLSEPKKRVFGLNFYYDYRDASKKSYRQVSAGLEALGITWDFRMNGYLPVGGKRSVPFDFDFELFPDDSFSLTAKKQSTLAGADAEVGYHYSKMSFGEIYSAAAVYFYSPSHFGDNTFGGRLRTTATFYTYLTLEALVSYDHVFKWIGQGALSLNIPLGKRVTNCNRPSSLKDRLYQTVDFNEIIVVRRYRNEL